MKKENDLWRYQHEEEEAKKNCRGPRKNEEMAWAPPRNKSDWPDWEEARSMEKKRVEAGARGRNEGARDHHSELTSD